jgi:hypothetical protein
MKRRIHKNSGIHQFPPRFDRETRSVLRARRVAAGGRARGLGCGLRPVDRGPWTQDWDMRHSEGCWQTRAGSAALPGYAPRLNACAPARSATWAASAPLSPTWLECGSRPTSGEPQPGGRRADSTNLGTHCNCTGIENLPKRSARFSSVMSGLRGVRATAPAARRRPRVGAVDGRLQVALAPERAPGGEWNSKIETAANQ